MKWKMWMKNDKGEMMKKKKINIVNLVRVDNMMKMVIRVGVEKFIKEIEGYVEEDLSRWKNFEKKKRVE